MASTTSSLGRILLIDDEEKLRSLLSRIIGLEGFEVVEAGDCKSGKKRLEQHMVDVVLCDVKLPDGSGVELVREIKQRYPQTEVILLTAFGNIADGVQAMKYGAFDYLVKGDDNNRIVPLLHRALEKAALSRRVQQLEAQLQQRYAFDQIIGQSKAIQRSIELAKRVAQTDTAVLLSGETGTGKEVFAQAIHQASDRSAQHFVAINCAAFGRDLLESEMFGHKAGSFTGAIKDKKGLFEEANKGTIFLDEIGELAIELQAKLLRVLETGTFIRIGDTRPTQVNVRLIAATHRNLMQEVQAGRFREDLFYRISVFQLHLPPLRERVADVEALAAHFVAINARKMKTNVTGWKPAFLLALQQHAWPGNIRELKNVIERSVILATGPELQVDLLPVELRSSEVGTDSGRLSAFALAQAERLHIQKVLQFTRGNKTKTAELLQIALTTLYRKMAEYKLD